MYEILMCKIETTYKNRQEAFGEINKYYKRGLIAKNEYVDLIDYARYILGKNGKIQRVFGH